MAKMRLVKNNIFDEINLNSKPLNSTVSNVQNISKSSKFRDSTISQITIETLKTVGSGTTIHQGYNLHFSDDGLYSYKYYQGTLYQFSNSSAFDTSDRTLLQSELIKSNAGNSFYMAPGGTRIWVVYDETLREYRLDTAWDISSIYYTGKSIDFTPVSATFNAIQFKFTRDGLNLAVNDNGDMHSYSLSTAFDISTNTYIGVQSVASTTGIRGFLFDYSGDYLYVYKYNRSHILAYSLATNGDVSSTWTLEYTHNILEEHLVSDDLESFEYSPDGLSIYYVTAESGYLLSTALPELRKIYPNKNKIYTTTRSDAQTTPYFAGPVFNDDNTSAFFLKSLGLLEEYSLSTPGDLSSMGNTPIASNTIYSSAEVAAGFCFSSDGTRLYLCTTKVIREYTLSPAWDITGDTFVSNTDISADLSFYEEITGIALSSDDGTLYISTSGIYGCGIYQYTLGTAGLTATLSSPPDEIDPSSISPDNVPSNGEYMYSIPIFSSDGTEIIFSSKNNAASYDNNDIFYVTATLSTSWDLTTMTVTGSIDALKKLRQYFKPVAISSDELNLYVLDITTYANSITLNLDGAFNLSNFRIKSTASIYSNISPGRDINSIIIGNHNLPEGVVITAILYEDKNLLTELERATHTLSSGDAGSAIRPLGDFIFGEVPLGEDTIKATNRTVALWTTQTRNCASIEILISSNTPINTIDIGRVIVGEYIDIPYNISYGHTLQLVDNSKQYRSSGGTLRTDTVPIFKKLKFRLSVIPEAYRSIFIDTIYSLGKSTDFFISLFPEDTSENKEIDYSGIFKLTKTPEFSEFQNNYYKASFEMEEV